MTGKIFISILVPIRFVPAGSPISFALAALGLARPGSSPARRPDRHGDVSEDRGGHGDRSSRQSGRGRVRPCRREWSEALTASWQDPPKLLFPVLVGETGPPAFLADYVQVRANDDAGLSAAADEIARAVLRGGHRQPSPALYGILAGSWTAALFISCRSRPMAAQ